MREKLKSFFDGLSIHKMLYVIFILNIVDAWLTLAWIKTGLAVEANPLMADLLEMGDVWFVSVKILAVALACGALCMLRKHTLAKRLSAVVCVVYMLIMISHIQGIRLLWYSLS